MPMDKPHVLLVEDSVSQTLYLDEILAEAGFMVSIVNSPDEWRRRRSDFHPDIIVLDIIMPVGREESGRTLGGFLAGVELHKEMHDYFTKQYNRMPSVIVLTAIAGARTDVFNRAKQYFDGLPEVDRPVWIDKPPNVNSFILKLRELTRKEAPKHE